MSPLLICHRGYGANRPKQLVDCQENTVDAVLLAEQHQYGMVEIDVQLTRDHQVVLWHDDALLFSTNHGGYLAEVPLHQMNYEDLLEILEKPDITLYRYTEPGASLEHYKWIDAKLGPRPKMHLLEDVLMACPHLRINIELKIPDLVRNQSHYKKDLVDRVAELCQRHQKYDGQYVLSSFDVMVATQAKRAGLRAMLLVSETQGMSLEDSIELAHSLHLYGVVCHYSLINAPVQDFDDLAIWSYGEMCPFVSSCIVDP